ncbi:MAG TPA: hypothetical protein VMD02_03430, partial [Candidatus Omnitrophota bacterium]|nr:hypothetical protein [Candidatus Omnitrophota bacterium]
MKKTTIILLSVCIMATFAIAANVNVGLDSNNGASSLVIRNSNSTSEASIDSLGRLQANGGVMGNINNIDSIGGYFTSTGPSGYGLYARNDENVGIYGRGYYGGSFESSDSGGIGLYSSARYSGGFGTWSTGYSTGGYFAALSTGGTNYGIYGRTNSPGGFAFYGDGGNDYFSGNVGLGTTAPNRKLYIATVEAGIAYGLKLDNYSSSVYHGINESVGILFSVDGVGYNNMDAIDTARGKGAIIYKQTSGWNRGSFYFL